MVERVRILDATVIVPTLGRVQTAHRLGQELQNLDPRPSRSLFVFQNREELRAWKSLGDLPNLEGLYCPKIGASAARNFGARQANSEFLIFLDDDCFPLGPSWVEDLVFPIVERGAILSTGAVVGWTSASGNFLSLTQAFRLAPPFLTPWGNPSSPKSNWCHTVAGGNFAVRRAVFEEFGGFSEYFGAPSLYEETELSLRLTARKKRRVWFSHLAAVEHRQEAVGGMRLLSEHVSEEFLRGQKKILLELVFGRRKSAKLRYYIFLIYRTIRSRIVLGATRVSGRQAID